MTEVVQTLACWLGTDGFIGGGVVSALPGWLVMVGAGDLGGGEDLEHNNCLSVNVYLLIVLSKLP
jgi:hypothetical protein